MLGIVGGRPDDQRSQKWRGPWRGEGAWRNLQQPVLNSTEKVSGGDQGGQNSARGRDHPKAPQVSQANGSMVGSVGRLLARTSGRQPCCWPVPPRLVLISGRTQATTQAPRWFTPQFPGVRHRSAFVRVLFRVRLQFPLPIDEGVSCRAPLPCAELLDVVSLLGYVRFAWRWRLLRCLTSTAYPLLSVLTHAFMLTAVALQSVSVASVFVSLRSLNMTSGFCL